MPLATVDEDVKVLVSRELGEGEPELAAYLLQVAEDKLIARIPSLLDRVQLDVLPATLVKYVEAQAVARVLRNPDGYRMEMEGSYSYQLDSRAAAGFLTILDDEWRDLGVSGVRFIAPETDGYAAARFGGFPPSAWMQFGWPGDAGPGMAATWGGDDGPA